MGIGAQRFYGTVDGQYDGNGPDSRVFARSLLFVVGLRRKLYERKLVGAFQYNAISTIHGAWEHSTTPFTAGQAQRETVSAP